ncbi:pupal cuticle protein-like [Anopheles albimanus]|uniref:Uncharacterized protein n=1 Tax=Anopheles albimanus TaxID=7167 RepID=A0A182FMM0_ANOAL|nr:pupal cuticle protein-like [Anopheles albimanus]
MKFLVIGSAALLLTVASASYLGGPLSSQFQSHNHHGGYAYGYADPNSQKYEQKDAHGVTHGHYSYVDANGQVQQIHYTADPIHGFRASGTNLPKGSAAPNTLYGSYTHTPLVLGHDGGPLETPEVQAAKAAHFAAHLEAKARLHKRSLYASWAYAHTPTVTYNGVPLETPEVQHAKAEHAAAHAKAHALHYGATHGGPISDTPEVAHAKAVHAAAHAQARAGHAIAPVTIFAQTATHDNAYHGPQHVTVIKNGVPVETPEVQHAKAVHFAAIAKAKGQTYAPSHSYYEQHIPVIRNGVPVETPEVQHAKAMHFAALAEASARSYANPAGHGHDDDGSYDGRWDNQY